MRTYTFNVRWVNGFTHSYEVKGGEMGTRNDPVVNAKERLNATRNIVAYNIIDEDGNMIYSMGDSDGLSAKA